MKKNGFQEEVVALIIRRADQSDPDNQETKKQNETITPEKVSHQ